MRLGRIVGVFIGIAMLLVIFFVPFAAIPGYVQQGQTLYTAFSGALGKVSQVQSGSTAGNAGAVLLLAIAGLIITIAGFVGFFPLGTGVLGVVGMGMLTAGPYFTGQVSSYSAVSFAAGFYILWAASIAALVMAFLGRQVHLPDGGATGRAKQSGGSLK